MIPDLEVVPNLDEPPVTVPFESLASGFLAVRTLYHYPR
jgi:hypothetical protein